jgi:hypothetical protein
MQWALLENESESASSIQRENGTCRAPGPDADIECRAWSISIGWSTNGPPGLMTLAESAAKPPCPDA